MKKALKRFLDLIPALILWLMFSVLVWGWIFTLLTDTSAENKVALFADAPVPDETALAAALEEALPEGVRMVKAHPFTYAMFGGEEIASADLYVVPASHVSQYLSWFRPLPAGVPPDNCLTVEGVPYGLPVRAGEAGGAAETYVDYRRSETPEDNFYLFFGASSLHTPDNENARDDAAVACALKFLSLP